MRNREHAGHISEVASVALDIGAGQSQRSTFGRPSESEIPPRVTPQKEDGQVPPVRDPTSLEPLERIVRYVTASVLRAGGAPWSISPAQPAALSGFNTGAGMQIWNLGSSNIGWKN